VCRRKKMACTEKTSRTENQARMLSRSRPDYLVLISRRQLLVLVSTKCLFCTVNVDLLCSYTDDCLSHHLDSLEELDLVPCPSCQTRMKQWQVFCHLDRCPGPIQRSTHDFDGRDGDFIPQSPPSRLKLGAKMARPVNGLQPERLAAVNYSLLKDQSLRKKLVDLGISSTGPRPLLEKRHREWLTIWNANCDAARPKAKTELLRDLDSWERAQGARGPAASRAAVELRSSQFDSTAWATRYQSSFRDLISRAKSNIQQHLSVDAQQVMDGQPVNELTAEASTALEAAYELSQESVDVIASGSIEEDKCSREVDIQAANSLQS